MDKFHWHEALDRTNIMAEMFEAHVAAHPVIRRTPDLLQLALSISDRIGELYQAIGRTDPQWKEEPRTGGERVIEVKLSHLDPTDLRGFPTIKAKVGPAEPAFKPPFVRDGTQPLPAPEEALVEMMLLAIGQKPRHQMLMDEVAKRMEAMGTQATINVWQRAGKLNTDVFKTVEFVAFAKKYRDVFINR